MCCCNPDISPGRTTSMTLIFIFQLMLKHVSIRENPWNWQIIYDRAWSLCVQIKRRAVLVTRDFIIISYQEAGSVSLRHFLYPSWQCFHSSLDFNRCVVGQVLRNTLLQVMTKVQMDEYVRMKKDGMKIRGLKSVDKRGDEHFAWTFCCTIFLFLEHFRALCQTS